MTNTKIDNRPKTPDKALQNKTNKTYTFWGNHLTMAIKIKHILALPTYNQ